MTLVDNNNDIDLLSSTYPAVAPEVIGHIKEEVGRKQFTHFWSKHAFAVNPDLHRQPPCTALSWHLQYCAFQTREQLGSLSDIVNSTQVHACSDA
jgi:hypothetical protein